VAKSKTIIYVTDDETTFLNVDVDVFSKSPLDALAAALAKKVSLHYIGLVGHEVFQLHFGLYNPKTANLAIRRIVKLIESLPRSPRRLWKAAEKRVFDVGFQGGKKPHCSEFDIDEKAVAAVARVGGSLRITIYPAPAVEGLAGNARRRKTR
jgi:hypothetical protein